MIHKNPDYDTIIFEIEYYRREFEMYAIGWTRDVGELRNYIRLAQLGLRGHNQELTSLALSGILVMMRVVSMLLIGQREAEANIRELLRYADYVYGGRR